MSPTVTYLVLRFQSPRQVCYGCSTLGEIFVDENIFPFSTLRTFIEICRIMHLGTQTDLKLPSTSNSFEICLLPSILLQKKILVLRHCSTITDGWMPLSPTLLIVHITRFQTSLSFPVLGSHYKPLGYSLPISGHS